MSIRVLHLQPGQSPQIKDVILVMKGGPRTNRDHNVGENWGSDRIQSYDAANYHQETWWYYGLQGPHSAEAYTFHNGRLVSHYQA